MAFDEENRLGYWDIVHPLYTSMNEGSEVFSGIWTEYNDDFSVFYCNCIKDMEQFTNGKDQPKPYYPPNILNISSLPWLHFTGMNINVSNQGLSPIFTLGKFEEDNDKILLPIAIQVHHAVCDGYHVGKFAEGLQALANDCERLLKI